VILQIGALGKGVKCGGSGVAAVIARTEGGGVQDFGCPSCWEDIIWKTGKCVEG